MDVTILAIQFTIPSKIQSRIITTSGQITVTDMTANILYEKNLAKRAAVFRLPLM